MALSDEQRAMLRLLAQRDQGYDDIAALMGLSVVEVRAKVVGALAQLEAEGQPRPDVPPPYPVAGEEGGPAVKEPEPEPAAEEPPPAKPKTGPRSPKVASSPKPEPAPAATPAATPSGGGRTVTIPAGRGLWPWIGGAVAIIAIVVIVVLIAGGGGGGSSASTEAAATTAETGQETAGEAESASGEAAEKAASSEEMTSAVLKPVGTGGATGGKAVFGRVKNKLALQVVAGGLETTGKNDAYTVWLAQSEQKMLPLASSAVTAKAKGKIAAQYEVPTEVLAYLANGTFDQIYITHTQNAQLAASLKAATQKKEAPAYTGEAVLKGKVSGPIVGAALREEEAQEAEEKQE